MLRKNKFWEIKSFLFDHFLVNHEIRDFLNILFAHLIPFEDYIRYNSERFIRLLNRYTNYLSPNTIFLPHNTLRNYEILLAGIFPQFLNSNLPRFCVIISKDPKRLKQFNTIASVTFDYFS